MVQLFLVLHVLGAIFVFGPSLAFTFLASETRKAPQHGHFAAVVGNAIERKVVLPGAVLQGITGVCLIIVVGVDLTSPAWRWLIAGIVLYAIAILYAFAVQAPAAEKMVELTAAARPPAADGAAPAGPPPEIVATGQKLARGGMFLTVLIVLIVILMVTKPGV
jgi:hypothetical protein